MPRKHLDGLAIRIMELQREMERIQGELWSAGPALIKRLTAAMSLRQLAKESGLSATYLSNCSRGASRLSFRAYFELSEIEATGQPNPQRL